MNNLEKRIELLENILDISSDTASRCAQIECTTCPLPDNCPLKGNRVTRMGSLLVSMAEEFRWYNAFMEEMTGSGQISPETKQRIEYRIRLGQVSDALSNAREMIESLKGIPEAYAKVSEQILKLETEKKELMVCLRNE